MRDRRTRFPDISSSVQNTQSAWKYKALHNNVPTHNKHATYQLHIKNREKLLKKERLLTLKEMFRLNTALVSSILWEAAVRVSGIIRIQMRLPTIR